MHTSWEVQHSPLLLAVLTDESGQDLSEYAVLIGLVALVIVVSVMLLGDTVATVFEGIGSSLTLN